LAELDGALCIAHAKRRTVNIWLLTGIKKDVWVKVFTIPVGRVVHLVPLRVMRPGGKLLFYYHLECRSAAILHLYDPCLGKCTDVVKGPTNITGRISLCGSHLDHRLCGQQKRKRRGEVSTPTRRSSMPSL
jgi:hypothetical protein